MLTTLSSGRLKPPQKLTLENKNKTIKLMGGLLFATYNLIILLKNMI
jgi:hypothetical protein